MDQQILNDVIALFKPDMDRINLAKARQSAVWQNQQADYLPICFGTRIPEQEKYKDLEFDMEAEFHNADVMLYKGLWGMIGVARSGSDAVPSIRPNFGTGFVATMFGLEPLVLPHTLPWLKSHLTKEQITNFEIPDDVSGLGLMPLAIDRLRYFRKMLGDSPFTYIADTQSPFDIAHLVRGDDIFLDLYDDPAFVHHLLNLTTEMYIKATKLMKQVSGEDLDSGCHGNAIWMQGGGARACEDSPTLLSPALIDEFVIPYLRRGLAEFGGGWVHYCGHNDHLLDMLIDEAPEVRGINYGNPERHDPAVILPRLLKAGKFYVGGWARNEGESDRDFLARILAPLEGEKRGLILQGGVDTSTPQACTATMELWHELQS